MGRSLAAIASLRGRQGLHENVTGSHLRLFFLLGDVFSGACCALKMLLIQNLWGKGGRQGTAQGGTQGLRPVYLSYCSAVGGSVEWRRGGGRLPVPAGGASAAPFVAWSLLSGVSGRARRTPEPHFPQVPKEPPALSDVLCTTVRLKSAINRRAINRIG